MSTDNKPKTLNGFDTQKIIELMLQPLSDKAYKEHPTKKYLTAISPDYTRERLTKIFGLFGLGWGLNWETHNTKEWTSQTSTGKDRYNFAIQQAEFWFSFGTDIISFPVTGYSDNDNLGDAMKGARTSCISDGAKQLLFQLHIYKNTDYQPPKFDDGAVSEGNLKSSPKPTVDQNTGEVLTSIQTAGFETNGKSIQKREPTRNHIERLFDEVQKRTNNSYKHIKHLHNTLKKEWVYKGFSGNFSWPDEDDTDKIQQTIADAVKHASNKADLEAATEE